MAKYFTPTKLSENIRETPEGFLVCIGVPIGRTGEMVYGEDETPLEVGDDGKVHVSRSAEDLFDKDAMASFEGKPFTIRHPEEFVSPENWKELAKGVLQNIRKASEPDEDGEESLLADILVTDSLAIRMIKSGLREVSCGYEAVYEQTGEGLGKQTNIIGNHVALVEKGRAGPSYAINDHQERFFNMSKWADAVKKAFSKAMDEIEKEKDPSKDNEKMEGSGNLGVMDELVKAVKDLGEKIGLMNKPKDESPAKKEEEKPKDEEPKKEEAPNKDEGAGSSVEERLKAIEMAVAKLMEMESAEAAGDEDKDKDKEKSGDEEEEESEDEGDPEEMGDATGDSASRAEILAPGIKAGKDLKKRAIEQAYKTKEGKEVIDMFTGGKAPTFDSAERTNGIFLAAAEILKSKRGTGLEGTKNPKGFETGDNKSEAMSAQKLNEINQDFWKRNK